MKKLFVGNLPWSATGPEIVQLLGENGVACEGVEVIGDRATGRSRGFAFAHFATDADAALAMDVLRVTVLGGRELVVSEAHSDGGTSRPRREDRTSRRGGGRSVRGGGRSAGQREGFDFDAPWRGR